jgi:hypothetical protein
MMIQLDPYIPVDTPKGEGYAVGWIDYSQEHHLMWIVMLDAGFVWIFENQHIRVIANDTVGRAKHIDSTAWKKDALKGVEAELKSRNICPACGCKCRSINNPDA